MLFYFMVYQEYLISLTTLESVAAFSLLSLSERQRLLDLHETFEEAKKGASEASSKHDITNPTQKQVG